MGADNPEDTDRIDRAEVERAARAEAEQAALEATDETAERPSLSSYALHRSRARDRVVRGEVAPPPLASDGPP